MAALFHTVALYPVSAINLVVLILGGGWMYVSQTNALADVRGDLARAKIEISVLEDSNRHAADLAETRYEGLRNDLASLRGSILAIQTDVSWLARGSRGEPAPPR
jgi:hypothetical protein